MDRSYCVVHQLDLPYQDSRPSFIRPFDPQAILAELTLITPELERTLRDLDEAQRVSQAAWNYHFVV